MVDWFAFIVSILMSMAHWLNQAKFVEMNQNETPRCLKVLDFSMVHSRFIIIVRCTII